MELEKVFTELTSSSTITSVRAESVGRYVESPISFWCSLYAPEEMKDPINDFQQQLFDDGNAHESRVNDELYPGSVVELFQTEEEGFRRTLEMMAEGTPLLKNMPLLCRPQCMEGRPDILERVDGVASIFGRYSYRIVEVKLARNLKKSNKLQAAFYNRLLGQVQGYEPEDFHMVNRDLEVIPIAMTDFHNELDRVLDEMLLVIGGKKVYACYGSGKWPWESYVNRSAVETNDVSLISGIGPAMREKLVAAEIYTVDDVSRADVASLTAIKGIGNAMAQKVSLSAQAQMAGQPLRRGPELDVRRGRSEVFFDFEGVDPELENEGLDKVNYLVGAIFRRGGSPPNFLPFFAESPDDVEANLLEFLRWAQTLEDPVFYHWHFYEKIQLTKMVEHYGIDLDLAGVVMDNMVDLSPAATKTFAFPCYGQTLKDVAKSLGFSWRQDDVTGVGSMALYQQYVDSGGADEEARRKIVVYNEDDCLATMHIFDWLLAQEN
ncbi:MAG: hypothetical protein BZY88_07870 [SAR202 cluster bacterium Io17-Chloro-G9]|nr:MAG: hypothetical protein BZY88_07870 [SAR202 cluster bacterium Io17-Chloro-G9]